MFFYYYNISRTKDFVGKSIIKKFVIDKNLCQKKLRSQTTS